MICWLGFLTETGRPAIWSGFHQARQVLFLVELDTAESVEESEVEVAPVLEVGSKLVPQKGTSTHYHSFSAN